MCGGYLWCFLLSSTYALLVSSLELMLYYTSTSASTNANTNSNASAGTGTNIKTRPSTSTHTGASTCTTASGAVFRPKRSGIAAFRFEQFMCRLTYTSSECPRPPRPLSLCRLNCLGGNPCQWRHGHPGGCWCGHQACAACGVCPVQAEGVTSRLSS